MAGFLSSSNISKIESIHEKLHETFSQNITVYKNGTKVLIAHDPKYNSVYGRNNLGKRDSVKYETLSETFDARVYYIDTDKELFNNDSSGSQIKVVVPDGSIKIFVKKDGFNFIKEARRVELDGTRFSIKSDGSPFGLTGNLFYTFYLFPLDESEE
jgi:hypothetical protein